MPVASSGAKHTRPSMRSSINSMRWSVHACGKHLEQPSDPDRRLRIAGPARDTASASSSRGQLTARASNQGMHKTARSKTSANEGTPHLGQPWIQHRRHRIASSPARNPSRHDHATSSETAITRHQEQTFFFEHQNQAFCFEASVHAQSTCSSPGIVIHVASILRENPNRHHSPSRLRKARFITHQSARPTTSDHTTWSRPEISIPISTRLPPCCTQKRIVTSNKAHDMIIQ